MKKINVGALIRKDFRTILKFLAVFIFIFVGVLSDYWWASAAVGLQHNWAWGLDRSVSAVMGRRGSTAEDSAISIKVGSSHGSDTDPILRIQIVNTGVIAIGDRVSLAVTDCTGVALKTCAGRALGSNTTTQFVYLDKQNATTNGIFRFRESDSSAFIGGDQIPSVVALTDHNPTPGIMVEGTTYVAQSTSTINSGAYPAVDYSFEYYGPAPTVQKTYMFTQTYNGVLSGYSGMHGSIGAILYILPANWNGSLIQHSAASITSATTATATIIFADDNNGSSTTSFSYSLWESTGYTTPAACLSIAEGVGHEDIMDQDGNMVHKRFCEITGLTANKIYFIKVIQTDADGIAGDATTILGPYFTNVASGTLHMHANENDNNASTTDDVGDLTEVETTLGGSLATAVVAGDGEYTLIRGAKMQIDSWNILSPFASNFTLNKFELRYIWGMNNTPETAQKLYISAPGTEPSLCASNGSGGTNWNLVETLPNASSNWIAERASTTITGYSAVQLADVDLCLYNTNAGNPAAGDVVGFDTLTIHPIFTPPSSGNGSPTTTTNDPTFVSSTGMQMNATYNTQNIAGRGYFEYGTTVSYGSSTPSSDGEVLFNSIVNHVLTDMHHHHRIDGLLPVTPYHFRFCLRAPPTAAAVCGGDMTTTTLATAIPTVNKSVIIIFE